MSRTQQLATWVSALRYNDLPRPVVEKTKDFFLDWYACAVGGRRHPAVVAMSAFARDMGPAGSGKSEVLHDPAHKTSSAFAALVNGAASHVIELDDLHNSSVVHPATIVFPAALAVAQEVGADGKAFITACVAGYEASCRVGEFLGPSHYKKFHMTATAGVFGAAAAAAQLLRLDDRQTLSAFGTAGTQAAGLWQFLIDATHAKQVHTAKAGFEGIFAAYTARAGLLGTADVLEGVSGMAAAMVPGAPNAEALTRNLGAPASYAILHSSYKWHASCRHTHGSADGLLQIMQDHGLKADDIKSVVCYVYRAAIDVLGRTGDDEKEENLTTVHQSKFNMGFVLAVIAKYGRASVLDFTDEALQDPDLLDFQKRVRMEVDDKIEADFPAKWQARVEVTTTSGVTFSQFVEVAKGDPGRHLTRQEIEDKARCIAEYACITDLRAFEETFRRVWRLENETDLGGLACV
ncbi:hypothetical protein F503_04839 [Ophiostoma piceae UAMH 11346]|uniref:2-methylcitrate dehydratase n=1 Tax=Ophiostoma piceae (strain UAMH 11346) TaxID=1262450 RepID=S3BWZ9_OPHP1|nr:hypothetical protein F503_04839 [Ophiostoma piceae UAMH 11346]